MPASADVRTAKAEGGSFTDAFAAAAKSGGREVATAGLKAFDIVALFRQQAAAGTVEPHKAEVLARVADAARGAAGRAKVVDVGCAIGTDVGALVRLCQGGADLVGVDLLGALVAGAQEDHPEAEFVEADMASLPFADASVDVVYCSRLLFHAADLGAVLEEFLRVLRPGGRAFAVEGDLRYHGVLTSDPRVAAAHAELAAATAARAKHPDAAGAVFALAKAHPRVAHVSIRAHTTAYADYSRVDAGLAHTGRMAQACLPPDDAAHYVAALRRAPETGEVVIPMTMFEVEFEKRSEAA